MALLHGVAASPAVGRDGSLYVPDYGAGLCLLYHILKLFGRAYTARRFELKSRHSCYYSLDDRFDICR
jgi:hypothetical protein